MIKIASSLAAACQNNLEQTICELEHAGVDMIHFDIEDGNFVPVMTLGVRLIKDLRSVTSLPFDVHLMMNDPEWIIPEMADMGVDMLSVHFEACPYPRRTLGMIHENHMQAGLAFNPKTQLPVLEHYLPYLDFVLILTTEPEEKNCVYLPSVLSKISEGRQQPHLKNIKWEVDGGFTSENITDAKNSGADIVVSGRGIFNDQPISENVCLLKKDS